MVRFIVISVMNYPRTVTYSSEKKPFTHALPNYFAHLGESVIKM